MELAGSWGPGLPTVILALLVFVLFPGIQFFLRNPPWLRDYGTLIYEAGFLLCILAARMLSFRDLGFSPRYLWNHLMTGAVPGMVVVAGLPLLDGLLTVTRLDQTELFSAVVRTGSEGEPGLPDLENLAVSVLLGPLVEQTFFSGFIVQTFLRKFHPVLAIYAGGVLFTLAHFKLSLGLFLLGLGSALLFRWTGTIYASLLVHACCASAGILLVHFYPRLITLLGFLF